MVNEHTLLETNSALLWIDKLLEDNNIDINKKKQIAINLKRLIREGKYFNIESLQHIKRCVLEYKTKV